MPSQFLDVPEPLLDWVLVMAEKYPEGSQKFKLAADARDRMVFTSSAVSWTDVLAGKALEAHYDRLVPQKLKAALGKMKVRRSSV